METRVHNYYTFDGNNNYVAQFRPCICNPTVKKDTLNTVYIHCTDYSMYKKEEKNRVSSVSIKEGGMYAS